MGQRDNVCHTMSCELLPMTQFLNGSDDLFDQVFHTLPY